MSQPTNPCAVRLKLEPLETRETPSAGATVSPAGLTEGVLVSQNFDGTRAGALPTGWSGWTSDGLAGFVASPAEALSPSQGARDTGGSSHAARAWSNAVLPADLQASAAVYLDSLVPGQVLLRGSDLGSGSAKYYAASVTRGMQVQLLLSANGSVQKLATVQTGDYFTQNWVQVSLSATGNRLQVWVQRADTDQWLDSSGKWQPDRVAAIEVRDSTLSGPGQAGVARPASYAGGVSVDDFAALGVATTPQPPTVAVGGPLASPAPVTGTVPVTATAAAPGGVQRVEFWVDGSLRATLRSAPYAWSLDTTALGNGQHMLTARAYDPSGAVGSDVATFTVANPAALPPIARHYSHIRIAELAYSGNPMGAFEQQLLRNSVDLVIPNAAYMSQIAQVSPNTPQFVYTNVSNLYGSLLTDWLNYADRNRVSRENAFFHVTQPTAFTGDSPSSQPVTWFWNVARGPTSGAGLTNLTPQAHGGAGGVAFGAAGEAVNVGYTDAFRELNVSLTRGAGAGWTGVLEYPSAVDANGSPTAWKPLPLLSDGTAGFRKSGTLLFDPPKDWKPATLAGYDGRLYYVRVRTVTGSSATAPVASSVLGADYVNARGGTSGVIPVFDSSADANHDGYLDDAEYARRKPGDDARFAYQSRLFYPYYGQMRFVTDPAAPAVQAWAANYDQRLLASLPLAAGLFEDNSGGKLPFSGVAVAETTVSYSSDYAAMLGAVNRAIAPRWVVANTAGGGSYALPVVRQVPGSLEEFALRPLASTWAAFEDLAGTVAARQSSASPVPYMILDSLPAGGSPTDSRTQIATLAEYYLLGNPQTTFLMFYGGYSPGTSWTQHWSPAAAYDVGQPVGGWSVRATGTDPSNPALTYNVYQRAYTNALVLYKPVSYATAKGTGTLGDGTATTLTLGGNYRPLNADGTLGAAVNRVTLRNGEGAVLIKA